MLTDADITKLKKVFVTKKEFREEIDKSNKYTEKLFLSLVQSVDNLSKELSEFKERTNKTLDWLVGAFKKFDEEHTILTLRYSTIGKTIDNHEIRITTLEKKPS
mgnify:CR=1 FL=1